MPSLRTTVATGALLLLAGAAALHAPLASSGGGDATLVAASAASAAAPNGTELRVSVGDQAFRDTVPTTSLTTYRWSPGDESVESWRTTADGRTLTQRVAPQADLPLTTAGGSEEVVVGGEVAGAYPVEGFGGALTDSAAYVINTSPRRAEIIAELFGDDGAELDVVRLAMGASDMVSTGDHVSYASSPVPDPGLTTFSIERDLAHVVPVLRDALALNPDLQVIAAPWSAPGWMKVGGTYAGSCWGSDNHLRSDMYGVYAQYYVRFLQAYDDLGLPVAQVSLGNEPQHCNPSYPTMTMSSDEQATLARELRPALDAAGFTDVEILGWDHNYVDQGTVRPTTYPRALIDAAGDSVDAIGYHCYNGGLSDDPSAHQVTDRAVWMTECTGTLGWRNTRENLVNEGHFALLSPLRYGAVASVYWNLALDASGGPRFGGCHDCRGMVTVDGSAAGGYTANEDLVYWSHLSRFVEPGAVRLASTTRRPVETVAYRNPDGSHVLVVLNTSFVPVDWQVPPVAPEPTAGPTTAPTTSTPTASPTASPTSTPTATPSTPPTVPPTTPPTTPPAVSDPVTTLLRGVVGIIGGIFGRR